MVNIHCWFLERVDVCVNSLDDPKSLQVFSDDQFPASFQNLGDVVGVHCACVEVFTRMVLVPVFVSLSQEFFQSELPSYDFLQKEKESNI